MNWTITLGSIRGIAVKVHITTVLLLAVLGVATWFTTTSLASAVSVLAFVVALLTCVVLHEFGHALAAHRFGITTRDVTVLPIGGLARLETMPSQPVAEMVIAVAGPAVNVAIAGLLVPVVMALGSFDGTGGPILTAKGFFGNLLVANVWLVGFNLIPAFPMDGGRVLRAVLAQQWGWPRATRTASIVGQTIAAGFAVVGWFTNPVLILIALFVWNGARQEAAAVEARSAAAGVTVGMAMQTDFRTLDVQNHLGVAARAMLASGQRDFPTVQGGRLRGILTRESLYDAIRHESSEVPVLALMNTGFTPVASGDTLEDAMVAISSGGMSAIPVVDDGRLVGLLTTDRINELLQLGDAWRRVVERRPDPGLDDRRLRLGPSGVPVEV